MKLLITGGTGFIGSNLINKLSKDKDNEIFALTRSDCVKIPGVTYISANLESSEFRKNLPDSVDCVVHMAQSDAYRDFPDRSQSIFNVNVQSTQILLDWAREIKIKKFLYFSSGNVYKQYDKLLSESDLVEPSTFYGSSKYMAEQLCKWYSDYFGVYILRPFAVYGPGQKGMFIQNIYRRILQNEPVILANNIGLKITPIYISDFIDAIEGIIYKPEKSELAIYNLCGSQVITMRELAQKIGFAINKEITYTITTSEPVYLTGNNKKVCNDLDLTFETDFGAGLAKTLETISNA